MRALWLLLLIAPTASAQSPLFPDGTAATRAAPHWRLAGGGGFADGALTGLVSLTAERAAQGPFAIGGRLAVYTGPGFQDDGPSFEGLSLDAGVSVGTRDRVLDVRALAGVGAALVNYDSGFCDEEFGPCPEPEASGVSPSPLVYAGVGLDLYVLASLGLGAEVRLSPTVDEVNFSSGEIGLRLRLAR